MVVHVYKNFKFAAIEGVEAFLRFIVISSVIGYEIILHMHHVNFGDDKFNRCGGRVII